MRHHASAPTTFETAYQAATRAINALEAQLNDGTPLPPDVQPLSPYCGCTDCLIRETLHAAQPHLTPTPTQLS